MVKVAVVAEVAAYIPGPVGAAAGAVSAGAYAAIGNKRKALQMSVVAAANMVGAGAAVKCGMKAASVAMKAGQKAKSAIKSRRSCNSFAPGTPVLLADGTFLPIEQVQIGDLVAATDPITGTTTAEPVLGTITGTGDKHMVSVQIAGATEPLVATANHPIWVEGKGWTHAADITPGDQLLGTTGGLLVVRATHDHGWLSGQTVHNLHIANTHTFSVATNGPTVVHNSSACKINANSLDYMGKTHVYKIVDTMATGRATVLKYGKGSALTAAGESVRANRQVRRLNRANPGQYKAVIISHHRGMRDARRFESALIRGYKRKFGARPSKNLVD